LRSHRDLTAAAALPQAGPSHLLWDSPATCLFLRQHSRMKFGDLLISSSKDKFLFWTCSASDFRIAFSWSSKSGNGSIGRNNQYRLVAKALIPNLL